LHHITNGQQHNTPFQWFPGHVHALISRLNPHKNFSDYLTLHCTSITTTTSGANASAHVSDSVATAASTTPMQGDKDDSQVANHDGSDMTMRASGCSGFITVLTTKLAQFECCTHVLAHAQAHKKLAPSPGSATSPFVVMSSTSLKFLES
jgi:hypothetical protein